MYEQEVLKRNIELYVGRCGIGTLKTRNWKLG